MEIMGVYGPGIFRGRKNADNQKLGCGPWPFTVFVLIFGTFWMFQKGKGWMALFLPKKVGGDGWRLWKPTGLEFLSAST